MEQRDACGLHEAVDLLAAAELGEGEDLVVGLEGLVLGQGLGREPRHFEPRVEDLHVAGVLLGVLDLLLELLHLGLMPALHGGEVGIRKASRLALPAEGRHEVPVQAGILHLLTADLLHHRLGQVGGDARRLGTLGVEGRVQTGHHGQPVDGLGKLHVGILARLRPGGRRRDVVILFLGRGGGAFRRLLWGVNLHAGPLLLRVGRGHLLRASSCGNHDKSNGGKLVSSSLCLDELRFWPCIKNKNQKNPENCLARDAVE